MLPTKSLKLPIHRPEICFVWTDSLFRVCLFSLSQNFKVGWFHIKIQTWVFSSIFWQHWNLLVIYQTWLDLVKGRALVWPGFLIYHNLHIYYCLLDRKLCVTLVIISSLFSYSKTSHRSRKTKIGWVCFFVESEKFFYTLNIHTAYFTHLYPLSKPLD